MEQKDYFTIAEALKNLNPLNDSCERALALATFVNGKMTRTESSFQELVVIVENPRKGDFLYFTCLRNEGVWPEGQDVVIKTWDQK